MINFINKYKILLAILLLVVFSFSTKLALLIFCIIFQIGSLIEIIKEVNKYKKTNKGKYAIGKLIEVRKIPGIENDVHNYEGTIEFFLPGEDKSCHVKYKFSSIIRPEATKKYRIWVDEKEPKNSVVFEYYGSYWKSSIFFLVCYFLDYL